MKNNYRIIIPLFLIIIIGLIMVYSSSSIWAEYFYNDTLFYAKRQFLFIIIGIVLMIFFN